MEIPKKIYLQIQEINDGDIYPLYEGLDECTWHADRVFASDIEYELAGENERMTNEAKDWLDAYHAERATNIRLRAAINYYFAVLDEVTGGAWREKPDHVQQELLTAIK